MSNVNGLSRPYGIMPTQAELVAEEVPNLRLVFVIETNTFYTTSDTDGGSGLLLASGNYANPVSFGGGGGGSVETLMIEQIATHPTTTVPNAATGVTVPYGNASVYSVTKNTISGASVNVSSQITLPAGTYSIAWTHPLRASGNYVRAGYRIETISGDTISKNIGGIYELANNATILTTQFDGLYEFELTQETVFTLNMNASSGSTTFEAASIPTPTNIVSHRMKITKIE